jgi:glycine reductase
VVVAGYLPRAQEAVIEMSGPGAALSPFGGTHNLVIEFEPAPDASWQDVDVALRLGKCRVAALLAEAALDAPPDSVEELADVSLETSGRLPRVGAIVNLQTQGVFKDVFVRGVTLAGKMPTGIDDRELDDGAVVCGQFGHPGLRNPTYLHQNNPVVAALRARDGVDLRFAGVILSPEPVEQAKKEQVCTRAAELAGELGWAGAIITKEGGGNADSDMSLKMDAMEDMGLSAVGIFAEMSGRDGDGPPVVGPPERASAMVSSGNYDERLQLPAVERAFGGERLEVAGTAAVDAVELPAAVILGSLSPLGWGRLTASP